MLWVVKLADVGVGEVVVVDDEGTEVGAEKNPGPVRGIIYVRPNWIIKGFEIHVCYRTGRGENPKKSASHSQDREWHHRQIEVD